MEIEYFSDLFENLKEHYHNAHSEEMALSLKEIFKLLIKKAKIRDEWSFEWSIINSGVLVDATSSRKNHQYTIGIFDYELYFESEILEAQNIKYMPCEFWAILSNLDLNKNFIFQDNAEISKKVQVDIKTGTANTYKIIRNYLMLEEHDPKSTINLGWFEARWSLSEPPKEVFNTATDVIKGIHKLNYMLYRREYQKQKSAKA
jgi:hypothetical protein